MQLPLAAGRHLNRSSYSYWECIKSDDRGGARCWGGLAHQEGTSCLDQATEPDSHTVLKIKTGSRVFTQSGPIAACCDRIGIFGFGRSDVLNRRTTVQFRRRSKSRQPVFGLMQLSDDGKNCRPQTPTIARSYLR